MKKCFRIQATQAISKLTIRNASLLWMTIVSLWFTGGSITFAHAQTSANSVQEQKHKANRENDANLTPFHAQYAAYKWDDEVGKAELKLEPLDPGQYSLTYLSEVSKFFLSDKRYEHSIFVVEDQKLIPEQYHYSRSGTGPDKKLQVRFLSSPDKHIVIDKSETLAWQGETDNQLYRIDIPRQLAKGQKSFEYRFVNYRGELKTYRINVVGEEHLTLPYGSLDAIKVKIMRKSNNRETFAWFAPKLDHNLVRLQQFKDGDEQGEIKLKSYTRL